METCHDASTADQIRPSSLLAAARFLPASDQAFSRSVVFDALTVNAIALAGLLGLAFLASAVSLPGAACGDDGQGAVACVSQQ
jgi:hypothetical protein